MIVNSNVKDNSTKVVPIQEGGFGTSSENAFYSLMLNIIRPIGSLYITSEAVHPDNIFGGTWKQITDGVLSSAGDLYPVGTTNGSNTRTFPLISHSHPVQPTVGSDGSGHAHGFPYGAVGGTEPWNGISRFLGKVVYDRLSNTVNVAMTDHTHSASFNVDYSGTSDTSIDISPVSYNLFVWRRVA